MPDKNKAKYKLAGFPKVLWLNLDRCEERRKYMEDQFDHWSIEDHVRISGYDATIDDPTSHLKGRVPDNMNPGEIGCCMTHLKALKYFVEETDLDEVMICEDDVDFSTAKHWTFNWKDIRKGLPYNFDTCQFTIINPNGITLKIHARFINDFSAACYLITRHYAEKVLKYHDKGNDRWRLDNGVRPRAVSEDLILDGGKGYAVPIFSYRLDLGSNIHPEHIGIFHEKSCTALADYWRQNGPDVDVKELMVLDEYAGRCPPSVYMDAARKELQGQ